MKKVFLFILILLCILAFAIAYASEERERAIIFELPIKEIVKEVKLPASVEIIEDEAFEGTALIKVELPDTVISIGERAFADVSTLREIRIPFSTKIIASSAFEGSDRITITAPINSYARTWAKGQGLPFSPIVMLCATTHSPSISTFSVCRSVEVLETENKSNFNTETQWRRIEEINISRIEELISNSVQGRAPPIA